MLGYRMLRQLASYVEARNKSGKGGPVMTDQKPAPIPQDMERFKLLFTNSRIKLPTDYCAPLDFKPTCTSIRERIESLSQA